MTDVEHTVADYYDRIWSQFVRWWDAEKTLGLHYALYEKGIKTFRQAEFNMSDYVGRLLELDTKKRLAILDAGCGVGGTSIYLAKKYPHHTFRGITISPGQYELAKRFTRQHHTTNATFQLCSYLDTPYQDNSYDHIFALESASYAQNKPVFIKEMFRLLKPGGTLAVVDTFFVKQPHNYFTKCLHDLTCIGRGVTLEEDLLIDDFIHQLRKQGFTDIKVNNLTRNVARSQLRSVIIGIPFFIQSVLKYLLSFGKADLSDDPHYALGTSVFCGIYGLTGAGKYISLTAKRP